MTTTELIELLKKYELNENGKPRVVDFYNDNLECIIDGGETKFVMDDNNRTYLDLRVERVFEEEVK